MRVSTEAKALGSVPLERIAPRPPPAPRAQPACGEAAGAGGTVALGSGAAAAGRWGTDKLLAPLYAQPSSPSVPQHGDARARLADTVSGSSKVRTKLSLTGGNISFSFRGVTGVHNPLSLLRDLGRAAAAARSLVLSSCSLLGHLSQVIWSPVSNNCFRTRTWQTHLLTSPFQVFPRFRHHSLSLPFQLSLVYSVWGWA